MQFAPDIEKARRIADTVNGFNNQNPDDLGGLVADVLMRESPDLKTLAAACGMVRPTTSNPAWHEQMRLALTAPLQAAMVEAQVAAQERLSTAADKLAGRNYAVALVSLFVSLCSLVVTVVLGLK